MELEAFWKLVITANMEDCGSVGALTRLMEHLEWESGSTLHMDGGLLSPY